VKKVPLILGLSALVLIALVYWPVLGYGILPTWDDTNFVVYRPEILDWWGASWSDRLTNPRIGYPIPLPTALYALLRHLMGEDGYFGFLHGFHVFLHCLNTGLAFYFIRGIWRRYDLKGAAFLPFAIAMLWALHPVLVESVAWLTNTKNLFSNFAILAALCVQSRVGSQAKPLHLFLLILLYVVALGSRPDGAILPFLLGFILLLQHGGAILSVVSRLWLATLGVLASISIPFVLWASSTHAEVAERKAREMSGVVEILFRMGRAVEISTLSLAFPFNLHPSYFYVGDETIIDALPGLAVVITVIATTILLLRQATPHARAAALGLSFMAAAFFPYSNVVFLPRLAADTYLYLPALGLVMAIGALLSNQKPRVLGVVFGALIIVFAFLSNKQAKRWENAITLWEPVIAYEPTLDRSYRHIAFEHLRQNRFEEAGEVIDQALVHFRRERDIPWYAIVIYRQVRGPLAAAEIGMEARLKNTKSDPEVHKAFVETLLIGKIPPPTDLQARAAIVESMEFYRGQSEWMDNETAKPAIAAYLQLMGGH